MFFVRVNLTYQLSKFNSRLKCLAPLEIEPSILQRLFMHLIIHERNLSTGSDF